MKDFNLRNYLYNNPLLEKKILRKGRTHFRSYEKGEKIEKLP